MPEKWETIEATDVFEASPYVTVRKEKLITGGGKVIDDFYQVLLRRFAICVPVTSAGEIVTIWQYKHGPRRESLTFPAGFVEDGEDPADCCRRELLEETGYAADRLVPLGEFVDNGNQRGCVGHYFAALDCQKLGEPDSGDIEQMEIRLLDAANVETLIEGGDVAIIHNVAAWYLARARAF